MLNLWGKEETLVAPAKPTPILEGFCCPACGLSNLGKEDMRKEVVGRPGRRHLQDVCRRCGGVIRYVEEQWHRKYRLREERVERLLKQIREQALILREQLSMDEADKLATRLEDILTAEPDEIRACEKMLSELRKARKCFIPKS